MAHADYFKEQLEEAAAHHLTGMKAALAAGDGESAKKHGVVYTLALQKLGHNPVGEPPPSVANKAKKMPKSLYSFKAHKADIFSL